MSSPTRSSHRLLYRGALALPDSYLLLDGLTFSARLDAAHDLLENPLALALESMRGRPTLKFMGTTSLKEIHMDDSGDISLDIHPDATLSQIYFENMFCLPSSSDTLGVRVALGDHLGPETTQIIIFLRPATPSSFIKDASESSAHTPKHILSVARITPTPAARPRLPRPDDPTPRQPPLVPSVKSRDLRKVVSFPAAPAAQNCASKKRKLNHRNVESSVVADLGSDVRVGHVQPPFLLDGNFKVPEVPAKSRNQNAKENDTMDDRDVFGAIGPSTKQSIENKGKRKRADEAEADKAIESETPIERENKNRIKQAVVRQLSKSSINKSHPDYKEVFNYIYRGVGFAMRADMKTRSVNQQFLEHLVFTHVGMYAADHVLGVQR